MASWHFRKKGEGEVERDPGWDEYFTSNRSTEESLIREAIQNSLDAHSNTQRLDANYEPAYVRIFYSGQSKALPKADYKKYLEDAEKHYLATDCKIEKIPEGNCPYVVIEDFNTTGLVGDVNVDYSNKQSKPPYYRFFWTENQSEKGEGTRGKWGIGKVVFPIASHIRSFFAYSIREFEKNSEVLCGKALLSYHSVNGRRYTADGWWGVHRNMSYLPETDNSEISHFKSTFNLSRNDEPGLSVVVPYVKDLDWVEMQRVLVENYMVSLVRGELKVELENGDGNKIVYDSANLNNIEDFLKKLSETDLQAKMLLQAFNMICEGMTSPLEFKLNLYDGDKPEWQKSVFSNEGVINAIREELNKTEADGETGKPVTIVVPMRIAKKGARHDEIGEYKVVLRRSPGVSPRPLFYRAGLFINRIRANTISNIVSVVLIDGKVSNMLNQAEPPSHCEWRVNTGTFKKNYKYPQEHIDFVVRAVRNIVMHIDDIEKGLDRSTLKNIFFVSRENRTNTLRKGKGSGIGSGSGGREDTTTTGGAGTGEDTLPNFAELNTKTKPYVIYQVKNGNDSGIVIKTNKDAEFMPFDLKMSFFYETLSGKVKFDENDFSFLKKGSLSIECKPPNLEVNCISANRLGIKVKEETKNFEVTIRGFDANRDLRVIPSSVSIKEDDDASEL